MPLKRLRCLVVSLSFLILLPSLLLAWSGKVVHIADGDTVTVLRGSKQIKLRLYGIDTPEKKQPFGSKAKRFTSKMVGDKLVEVDPVDRDHYGRTVGLVYMDGNGQCLNEELVSSGLAWVYDRYCEADFCESWQSLQEEARKMDRGLWSQKEPVAPWDWRHGNHGGQTTSSRAKQKKDKNCSDFKTQAAAQNFFEAQGPGDPHNLDGDGDGEACEGLP